MDAYRFWDNLDKARGESITLKDLCKKIGIAYQRLADQRSDCRFPKLEDAYALAKAIGVSLDYLITGESLSNLSPEAQFVETNETMRTLVRYCMNDTRLLPALELIIEQTRSDKGVDNKGLA